MQQGMPLSLPARDKASIWLACAGTLFDWIGLMPIVGAGIMNARWPLDPSRSVDDKRLEIGYPYVQDTSVTPRQF